MGHSNGKITAPINLGGDVYPTLGIGALAMAMIWGMRALAKKLICGVI